MSNFVFDSDVNCNDGDDIAFFTFSGSIPKKLTDGDFSASTDSVPALFNMITAGEDLGSIAAKKRQSEIKMKQLKNVHRKDTHSAVQIHVNTH